MAAFVTLQGETDRCAIRGFTNGKLLEYEDILRSVVGEHDFAKEREAILRGCVHLKSKPSTSGLFPWRNDSSSS